MATPDTTRAPATTTPRGNGRGIGDTARRLTTETKSFFKTSEFWTFLLVTVGILIAGNAIEIEEGGTDYFAADKVWLYITILAVGYMVSRGIAKAGVRDPYWSERGDRDADH